MTANNFDKPLDTWIDEPIEINVFEPVLDKRGNVRGIKEGKRTVMQKTRYSRLSEPQKMACSDMNHDWFIPDPHEHIAHCKGCPKRQFIRAVYEKVADGKILDRDTGEQIN